MTEHDNALGSTTVTIGVIGILLCVGCAGLSSKSSPSEESVSVQIATETERGPVVNEAENEPTATGTEREPVATEAGNESVAAGTSNELKETTGAMNVPASVQEEVKPSPSGETTPATPAPTAQSESGIKPPPDTEQGKSIAKLESVPDKPVVPSPVVPEPAAKAVPEQVEEQEEAPLDLALLEKRLKETSSIGFFTKIALKNQVDELLNKFRAFYEGHSNFSLAQLRQPFDLLIMKVLALLQDSDPQLANDILVSREAIWDILSDREKFAKI